MSPEQKMVEDFHRVFELLVRHKPTKPSEKTKGLRISLIQEELDELNIAFHTDNMVAIADAIGDLLYVVYGTAVSCGIDMEEIFREIHHCNMTKVGGHKRADGKWIKPKSYQPAEQGISMILTEQGA